MLIPGVGGVAVGELGRASGQLNVAVAVWIVPSVAFVSAMMVAVPDAYAVTIPAVAPGPPDEL